MDTSQCQGVTKSGAPCAARPLPGEHFCPWHSPTYAEKRRDWQRQNGAQKANQMRARKRVLSGAKSLEEVDAALCLALEDVLAGRIEPGVASAAATVAKAISAVRTTSQLEQQITELAAAVGVSVKRGA